MVNHPTDISYNSSFWLGGKPSAKKNLKLDFNLRSGWRRSRQFLPVGTRSPGRGISEIFTMKQVRIVAAVVFPNSSLRDKRWRIHRRYEYESKQINQQDNYIQSNLASIWIQSSLPKWRKSQKNHKQFNIFKSIIFSYFYLFPFLSYLTTISNC